MINISYTSITGLSVQALPHQKDRTIQLTVNDKYKGIPVTVPANQSGTFSTSFDVPIKKGDRLALAGDPHVDTLCTATVTFTEKGIWPKIRYWLSRIRRGL